MHFPSHSTVVAYAALIAAVGGGTVAGAASVSRNSVGSTQIRDRSVQTRDLARNARPPSRARIAQVAADTATSQQVLDALSVAVRGERGEKGDAGTAGPAGPAGQDGVAGLTVHQAVSTEVDPGQEGQAIAQCGDSERAISGGGNFETTTATARNAAMSASIPGDTTWTTAFRNNGTGPGSVRTYVVCAQVRQ